MPFLRQSYKQKPKQWGPFPAVKSALRHNAEKYYGIDYDAFVIATPMWERGGSVIHNYKDASNNLDIFGSGVMGNDGFEKLNTNVSGYAVGKKLLTNAGPFTLVSGRKSITPNATKSAFAIGGARPWSIGIRDNSLNFFKDWSSGDVLGSYTVSLGDSIHRDIALSWNNLNSSNEDLKLYIQGKNKVWTSRTTGGSARQSVGYFSIGGDTLTSYRYSVSYLLLFNSVLTSGQIALLSDNPWQLWQPYIPPVYSFAPVSGSTLLPIMDNIESNFIGKVGVGGGLISEAGSATLLQDAKEGKNCILEMDINNLLLVLFGKQGEIGSLESNMSNQIFDLSGKQGNNGQIDSGISISALIFGETDGEEPTIFEGTISSIASIFNSEILGNTGVDGSVSSQIIFAASLAGKIGNNGSYTMNLDGVSSLINGILGNSGVISATISAGSDLAGKIGVSAEIISSLNNLDLQLLEIVKSDRIYQIVISTKTGQVVFLAPKTNKINIKISS